MVKKILLLLIIVHCSLFVFSQNKFKLDTTRSPKYYLNYILDTNQVKIANVKYRGLKSAIGQFSFDTKSFEIKNGIALSSGNLGSIKGGNKTPGTSGLAWDNKFRFKGDRDLGKLSKGKVCDQAFIEFDFIPLDNEVKFNYIFASEEYKEYVGSRFNDVFGFIITGEGNFFKNIAIIPQKTDPVAINNVNHLRNSEYFINNACFENSKLKKEVDDMEPREPFIKEIIFRLFGSKNKSFKINEDERKELDNELFENFEFDGLTRKLIATCFLTPYKLYHMKIAVGDVGDPMFDSGVFLEYQSFTSTKNKNAPYFKNYEDQRETFNFDSLFKYRELKPILIDSPPMIEERFEITNVNFDYNQSIIPDSCQINIRELSIYLKKNKDYRLQLLGFTDNIGTLEFNQKLSEKRAIEVKKLLMKNGVKEERINYIGNNFSDPLATNSHEKGRAKNRRVEIVVLEE